MRPSGRDLEKLVIEARARITWGDSAAQVRDWLLSQKINDFEADGVLRELLAARAASMRKRGVVNVVVGLAAIVAAAIVGWMPWILESQGIELVKGRAFSFFIVGSGLIGIYGAKQLIDGIERILRGARAEGADTDVSDS
jgi:hypothetical protein